ncbi:MAG: hypothetical protein NVS4B8_20460 [Herpetosiphon sp.]
MLDLLELDAGGIYTAFSADRLTLAVHRGMDLSLLPELDPQPAGVGILDAALQSDGISVVEAPNAALEQSDFQTLVMIPLLARAHPVGLLLVLQRRPYPLPTRLRALLEAIGDHVAMALDNARLYATIHHRQRQTEALRQVALALTEPLDIDAVLGRIVEQAMSLMDAPMCALYTAGVEQELLTMRISRGLPASYSHHHSISPGGFGVGEAVSQRDIVAYSEAALQDAGLRDGVTLPYHSLLAAPLIVKGQVYGGIVVYYQYAHCFTNDEDELLRIFASQAALALDHASLVGRSRQLAALEERQRLARDLHDSVTQTLFSLTLAAQAARSCIETRPAAVPELLQTVQELATGALAEMRALLFELRPGTLREAGIHVALERQTTAFAARTGIAVKLEDEGCPCSPDVEEALYRIAGEALNNISRHAHATSVVVSLTQMDEDICLSIQDNGVGFDPADPRPGDHLGLHTMQERAVALGGSVRIHTTRQHGTLITATLPCKAA